MARRALETTRTGRDPRLSALLHSRVALGHACQGEAGRAGHALVLAEKALDAPVPEPSPWLAFVGPAEILSQASLSHHLLGRLGKAEQFERQALSLNPAAFQRNRFAGTVHLASCQLDARHVPDAASTASTALDLLPAVRSALWTGKLTHLRRQLEPYRHDTQVLAFTDRFDAAPPRQPEAT